MSVRYPNAVVDGRSEDLARLLLDAAVGFSLFGRDQGFDPGGPRPLEHSMSGTSRTSPLYALAKIVQVGSGFHCQASGEAQVHGPMLRAEST
jgi:hypothetical protein